MSNLTPHPLQQLQDHLSLIEAAAHIVGLSITRLALEHQPSVWLCGQEPPPSELICQLQQALQYLQQALHSQQLAAQRIEGETLIAVSALKHWLAAHQLYPSYFFGPPAPLPDYLDPNHPRYAAKLALTICAWQDTEDSGKRSPKQALADSLRRHAAAYGQLNAAGQPIKQVIEECGKVGNWQPRGGAPRASRAD